MEYSFCVYYVVINTFMSDHTSLVPYCHALILHLQIYPIHTKKNHMDNINNSEIQCAPCSHVHKTGTFSRKSIRFFICRELIQIMEDVIGFTFELIILKIRNFVLQRDTALFRVGQILLNISILR